MGWIQLLPHNMSEADIQEYFANWSQSQVGLRAAGAPEWLTAMRPRAANQYVRTGLGYGFRPDLLATSGTEELVFELKCASKGEPLALGEVLHHTWMLAHDVAAGGAGVGAPQRTPVLVTQYNNWLRAALAQLRAYGMREDAIRFVEFTTLKASEATLVWFDEPFADWDPCDAPLCPEGLEVGHVKWRRVKGAGTWIAMKEPPMKRPPVWTSPYLMLTAIPEQQEFLTWSGAPNEPGRYLLWTKGTGSALKETPRL